MDLVLIYQLMFGFAVVVFNRGRFSPLEETIIVVASILLSSIWLSVNKICRTIREVGKQ